MLRQAGIALEHVRLHQEVQKYVQRPARGTVGLETEIEVLMKEEGGIFHEVEVKAPSRWIFEVAAGPVQEREAGWVLVIRDATDAREA